MPLLVLAQTPPPTHGQSVMVQTAVEGLPSLLPGVAVHHQNLALSGSGADIGRWKLGKLTALRTASRGARDFLRANPGTVLYYVPAPGKRIAALRDCLLLPSLRRHASALVLHWHGAGLGAWSASRPLWRRWLWHALGGAELSILPSGCVRSDAEAFGPKRLEVVPNGITDPFAGSCVTAPKGNRTRVLFIGACSEEKGILVLAEAWKQLITTHPNRFELMVAGTFADEETERAFRGTLGQGASTVNLAGFVSGEAKQACIQNSDIVCIPTHYPYEIQPLVALEALAADKVVVATRWRGIPELLEGTLHRLADPRDPADLMRALADAPAGEAEGKNRSVFLARFSRERHLAALARALAPELTKPRP